MDTENKTNIQQNIQQSKASVPASAPPAPQQSALIGGNDSDVTINLASTIQLSESPDSTYHYFMASPMYAGFGDLNSPERVGFLQNLSKTSSELKNFLTSADTVEIIFSIGKEYELEDGQISILSASIRELISGSIFVKDFPALLSSKFGIDDVRSSKIANGITSRLFGPIIEDLKRIQRSKFPEKIMELQKERKPIGLAPQTAPQPRPPFQMPPRPMPPVSSRSSSIPPRPVQPLPWPRVEASPIKPEPMPARQLPNQEAQKSLEEELEKVANVIDLRSKPRE